MIANLLSCTLMDEHADGDFHDRVIGVRVHIHASVHMIWDHIRQRFVFIIAKSSVVRIQPCGQWHAGSSASSPGPLPSGRPRKFQARPHLLATS